MKDDALTIELYLYFLRSHMIRGSHTGCPSMLTLYFMHTRQRLFNLETGAEGSKLNDLSTRTKKCDWVSISVRI